MQKSLTINEFCEAEGISRSTFYVLEQSGKAPRYYRVGKSIRISREAQAEWRREREAEAAAVRAA